MGSIYIRKNKKVSTYMGKVKVNGKWKHIKLGRVGIATKSQAKARLRDIEIDIQLGEWNMLTCDIPTLNEFILKDYMPYIRDTKKNRSWKRDQECLKNCIDFFGDRKLSEMKPKDIDDYKSFRLKKVTPGTVNRELAVLRSLFNLAGRWNNFFGKNPVSESGLLTLNNKKERILTPEEEDRLLFSSSTCLRAIIICVLNTGMRKGEPINLKWNNIDSDYTFITLQHTNTKNKKTRKIPISLELKSLLLRLKLKSGGSEYVFLNEKGKPYKREGSLNSAYNGACRRAGIKGLRFHDLRHTFATRMIESGHDISEVAEILGHSDLNITRRYSHPRESLKKAVEAVSKMGVSKKYIEQF